MFSNIVMINYARPLAERAASRKVVGPYRWSPSTPGKGRGFYQAGGSGLECGDSTFRLRLEWANDHLGGSRLSHTTGYYCDLDGEGDTLQPIIARLPHGRGFLAGWTMGPNMAACLDGSIYIDEYDAARAAHDLAEYDAEESRLDQMTDDESEAA